jgi:hypothetical protein
MPSALPCFLKETSVLRCVWIACRTDHYLSEVLLRGIATTHPVMGVTPAGEVSHCYKADRPRK